MGRIFFTFVLALVVFGAVGYYLGLFETNPSDAVNPEGAVAQVVPRPDELGPWLYPPAKEESKEPYHRSSGMDPVILQGHLTEIDKIDVPSKVSGPILYVGDGVPEGVTQLAGVAPFLQSAYNQANVLHYGRRVMKFYKPLQRGNEVAAGQMVAEIDYSQALYAYLQHKTLVDQAGYELESAKELDAEAKIRLDIELRLGGGVSSQREISDARLTRVRTKLELAKAETAIKKEEVELENAKLLLAYHEIYPKRVMRRSFIKQIYRDTGEAAKELEPILQLYSIDRLMAEAFVDFQYAQRLRTSNKRTATIEPVIEQHPLRRFEGHRGLPITGVAFVQKGADVFVVSAGEDGQIMMWQQHFVGNVGNALFHGDAIKAMACSPAGAKQTLCLAGMQNGTIHVWNLFPKDDAAPAKVVQIDQAHHDPVTALAFSPDGQFFASGAADGGIKLWRAEDGKLVYAFDAAHGVEHPHQGAVTSLHFTPHSRLVSAARDDSLRVWDLKERGAHPHYDPLSNRGGTVHQLGVSQDGRFMLFDQGKSLQMYAVADRRMINWLKSPGGATSFETLAVFAPDGSLVMTGGAPEGRLQVWRTPTQQQRGFEVRQYVTDERAGVTCAAFAPAATGGGTTFAASGSKDGSVYLWPAPPKQELDSHQIHNVPVRLLQQTVEAGSRQVRLGVEVQNPDGRLTPGRPVTIVFE
jgi:WD40 repeat protein